MKFADRACSQVGMYMEECDCSLPVATARLKSHPGFVIRAEHAETIGSLTKRYQMECSKLMEHTLFRLGILQHESLVELIRMHMKKTFGLEPPVSQ